MKKLALVLLLFLSASAFAATHKPNPADFTVKVHVISSSSPRALANYQVLETTVDDQPVELTGFSQGVLALGDYPARLSKTVRPPSSHPNTYDIYRGYDLLMPDGTTRTYTVTGLGPVVTNP